MDVLDYVLAGMLAVFQGAPIFSVLGVGIPLALVMVIAGFLAGILVGAIPGIGGVFLMAVSLPILISIFGFSANAILPVFGFLIGVMKGSTVGGAVPAILFNTPGTPDSLMTTLDGYPLTQKGQSGKALRIAHFSSAAGDTFSDIVLFTTAPFLAIWVERYLGFTEKAALIILSLAFIASVVGRSPIKGMLAGVFGIFIASIGTGEDSYARLSLGMDFLDSGFPLVTAVLGVLILGEIFLSFETLWREQQQHNRIQTIRQQGDNRLHLSDIKRIFPYIGISAAIGTMVGALPGIGSTLAATLGYASGRKIHKGSVPFGEGTIEGVAATEAANSAVSGANLIPVLSLGIPGNVSAVFLILAAESIGGFNPGPSVFRFNQTTVNTELVVVFGIFTMMMVANILNWTIGGLFMRFVGVLVNIPRQYLLPAVLLLTLTAIYIQNTNFASIIFALGFGFLGYLMRKLDISVLPFVIAFILTGRLEETVRQAFSASGSDPYFLLRSPIAMVFLGIACFVAIFFSRNRENKPA